MNTDIVTSSTQPQNSSGSGGIRSGQVPTVLATGAGTTTGLINIDNIEVLKYQIESLKDEYEELEESYHRVQKDFKLKSRQHDSLNRDYARLEEESKRHLAVKEHENQRLQSSVQQLQLQLEQHQQTIDELRKRQEEEAERQSAAAAAAASAAAAQQFSLSSLTTSLLGSTGSSGIELPSSSAIESTLLTSPEKLLEFYRESSKQTREFQYKAKKAEQECAVLQTNVTRLENQITRLKQSLKEAEDVEDELKAEKRKLLRELREAQAKVDELETTNSHLQKRIDKMRSRNLGAAIGTSTSNLSTTATPSAPATNASGSTTATSSTTGTPTSSIT